MLTDRIEAKSANIKVEYISDNSAKFNSIAISHTRHETNKQ